MIKASILGANGYTGLELMNILSCHDGVALQHLISRSNDGAPVTSLYPSLTRLGSARFCNVPLCDVAHDSDVVFAALPHGASAASVAELIKHNPRLRIIDLSADFRYRDLALYEQTYKVTHPCPELIASAVYGFPEMRRSEIKAARIVGNPGCYSTSVIAALMPLITEGVIEPRGIIADCASGVSGAGRKAELDYIFTEVDGSYKAYAVASHRHNSEIEDVLGEGVRVTFVPHLLPIKRGILSTIYAVPKRDVSPEQLADIFNWYYGEEQFVQLYKYGAMPEIKHVAGSNNIGIGFKLDAHNNRLIVVSALDNLIKGASGQAVQNMNLAFGLDEAKALPAARYL